jgi:hypothetical protein
MVILAILAFQIAQPGLRDELLEMEKIDQLARNKIDWNNPQVALVEEMQRIDRKNAKRLAEIVDEHGWPGKSLVGEDGARAAWLIVQHATHDTDLMKRCLAKMRALPKTEVAAKDVAYLVDRVELLQGRKQIYGTQLRINKGELVLEPIDDPDRVDERRAVIGLGPLADYIALVRKQLEK